MSFITNDYWHTVPHMTLVTLICLLRAATHLPRFKSAQMKCGRGNATVLSESFSRSRHLFLRSSCLLTSIASFLIYTGTQWRKKMAISRNLETDTVFVSRLWLFDHILTQTYLCNHDLTQFVSLIRINILVIYLLVIQFIESHSRSFDHSCPA